MIDLDAVVAAVGRRPRTLSGFRTSVEHMADRLTRMDAKWGIDVTGGPEGAT